VIIDLPTEVFGREGWDAPAMDIYNDLALIAVGLILD
jgi:hypothetical protein